MTIINRTELKFEGSYTMIPNAWARDATISRRARGLLLEIMSHRSGWKVTVRSLANEHEGRDAVAAALNELIDAGYLAREQSNEAGRFGEVVYTIVDPSGDTASGFTGSGSTASGDTASGKSAPYKKTIPKKTNSKKTNSKKIPHTPAGAMGVEHVLSDLQVAFQDFYALYPRKVGKDAARRAFATAVQRAGGFEVIILGARRFASDPNLPSGAEARFIPHPATWLNRGGWEDEPLPPRIGGRATAAEQMVADFFLPVGGERRELSA